MSPDTVLAAVDGSGSGRSEVEADRPHAAQETQVHLSEGVSPSLR
jgi:hypothetical protein